MVDGEETEGAEGECYCGQGADVVVGEGAGAWDSEGREAAEKCQSCEGAAARLAWRCLNGEGEEEVEGGEREEEGEREEDRLGGGHFAVASGFVLGMRRCPTFAS